MTLRGGGGGNFSNSLDMPPNKILLPFHLIVRIFIKRTFLLSGSQLTRLYCIYFRTVLRN